MQARRASKGKLLARESEIQVDCLASAGGSRAPCPEYVSWWWRRGGVTGRLVKGPVGLCAGCSLFLAGQGRSGTQRGDEVTRFTFGAAACKAHA